MEQLLIGGQSSAAREDRTFWVHEPSTGQPMSEVAEVKNVFFSSE